MPKPIDDLKAQAIRFLVLRAGGRFTQEELAVLFGVSVRTVRRIVSGEWGRPGIITPESLDRKPASNRN